MLVEVVLECSESTVGGGMCTPEANRVTTNGSAEVARLAVESGTAVGNMRVPLTHDASHAVVCSVLHGKWAWSR